VITLKKLKQVFKDNIIPLLQEYFYGDYGKMGLILGSGFVYQVKLKKQEEIFADFQDYDDDITDLKERKVYRIVDLDSMSDDQFKEALQKLIKTNDGKEQ